MASGMTRTTTYGADGNPNFPGTVAYQKLHGTYVDPVKATQSAMTASNTANKKRETEIRGLYDNIIKMYSAGGSYGQGVEAQLERERTQTLSTGGQSLISSGLYNTTGLAGLSTSFAENVAAPTRAKLEDLRTEKLASALGQKADFINSISDSSVSDYLALAQILASQ